MDHKFSSLACEVFVGQQGRYMLAFPSAMDGVRFCHGLQLSLLFTRWPNDLNGFEGAEEHGPDGRLVFRGLRVAMSIHDTAEYRYAILPCQCHQCIFL